jgi:hypothetical protein
MACILSTFMAIYLRMENNRRDKLRKNPEEYTTEEKVAERTLGDNASFFRHLI